MSSTGPKIRRRGRIVFITDKDAAEFGDLVKGSFPEIEFAVVYLRDRILARFPTLIEAVEHARSGGGFYWLYGWIPSRRWRPRWGPRYKFDKRLYKHWKSDDYVIANLPPRWFMFDRPGRFSKFDPKLNLPVLTLHPECVVEAHYDLNDMEVRRFVDKVFRLLGKVTVNRFSRVVPQSHEIVDRYEGGMYWAGREVLEICRKQPDHYITQGGLDGQGRRVFLKPYDWAPD